MSRDKFLAPAYLLACAALLAGGPFQARAATQDTFIGPDNGVWSDVLNWSAGFPSNSALQSFDVLLELPRTVLLNTSVTVDTLALATNSNLTLLNGNTLTLAAGALANNGFLFLNDGPGTTRLFFTADTALSGNGVIVMRGPNSLIDGSAAARLTTSVTISGQGVLGNSSLKFSNSGLITATTGVLTVNPAFDADGFTNSGTLRADGGSLSLSGGTIVNAGAGAIEAVHNSVVTSFSDIVGGTLRTQTGGTIALTGGSLQNVALTGNTQVSGFSSALGNVSNSGTLALVSNVGFIFGSNGGASTFTLTNTGLFTMVAGANLILATDSTLNGGGTLALAGPVSHLTATGPYRLTTDNLITGIGSFGDSAVRFTNNGTIQAAGGVLTLVPAQGIGNFINAGTLRANAGTLSITANVQSTGRIEAFTNSLVLMNRSSEYTGGVLQSFGGGTISLTGGTLANLSLAGLILGGGSLTLAGVVTNAGVVRLSDTARINLNADAALAGAGAVTLNSVIANGVLGARLTSDNSISGSGSLGLGRLRFSNMGTIAATGLLEIAPQIAADSLVNTGILRAEGGGTLSLVGASSAAGGVTVINTAGTIEALANSVVSLSNRITIMDGLLRAEAGGLLNFVAPGTITLTAPIALANGVATFNAATQSIATISGPGTVTLAAAKPLTSGGVITTVLNINGTHTLRTGSTYSKISTLALAHSNAGSSAAYTATLNLTNNGLVVQSASPADKAAKLLALNEALFSGKGSGDLWTGPGITSSTAAANPAQLTVGVFDNAALGKANFAGGSNNVDANSLLVTVALKGDANLDGIVNFNDMLVVTGNWNRSGLSNGISTIDMAHGDLNGDGIVNFNDMLVVTGNWNNSSSTFNLATLFADPQTQNSDLATQNSPASVPEPASLALLISSLVFVASGRHRFRALARRAAPSAS